MRTLSADQTFVYGLKARRVACRVRVEDGDGLLKDLTDFKDHDWLISASWEEDIDTSVASATIVLRRNFYGDSIAPYHQTSRANLNSGGSYDQLLDLMREIRIETATVAEGKDIVSGDWVEMFRGQIDRIEFGKRKLTLTCRDQGGLLQDTFQETVGAYGSSNVQTAMQDILDDTMGGSAPTLYTPTSPGWVVTDFANQLQSLMDELQGLADMIGWYVRYFWDNGSNAFRLTFSEIDRSNTTPDYSFDASQYYEISEATVDLTSIRNACSVSYQTGNDDATGEPVIATYTSEDLTSIGRWGRRWMGIQLDASSLIDSATEAQALADAAVNDLKDPIAYCTVRMPYFHAVQLGDLYTFEANGEHFTSDQDLAVVSVKHTITAKSAETSLTVKGETPTGRLRNWYKRATFPRTLGGTVGLMKTDGPGVPGGLTVADMGGRSIVKAGGARRADDLAEYEWHIGDDPGFDPDFDAGSLTYVARSRARVLDIPADETQFPVGETRYIKVVGIDSVGNRGTPTSATAITAKRYGAAFLSTESRLGAGYSYGTFAQQSRGTAMPPDGWTMVAGAWGTDVDVDIGATYARSKTGSTTMLLKSTGVAATLKSDPKPVTPGRSYDAGIECRASSVSAGRSVTVKVRWLDADQALLQSDTIHDDVLPLPDVWTPLRVQMQPPSEARYAQFFVAKAAESFELAVDRIIWEECGAHSVEEGLSGIRIHETFIRDATAAPWGDWGWREVAFTQVTVSKVAGAAAAMDEWSETGVVEIEAPAQAGQGGGLSLVGSMTRAQFYGRPPYGTVEAWKIRIPTATANFTAWAGMWSTLGTNPDYAGANTISGIGFVCRTASGNSRWYGVCRDGTSETTRDLDIEGADPRWRTLGWRRTATGIQFMVDDDDVGTVVTTNLPTTSTALAQFAGIISTSTDATKTMQIDDYAIRAAMVRNRRQPDDDELYYARTAHFGHSPADPQTQRIRVPDGYSLTALAFRSNVTPTGGSFTVERDVDNTTTNQLVGATYDPTALTADTEANPTLTATTANLEYEGNAWIKIVATGLDLGGASNGLDVAPIFERTV